MVYSGKFVLRIDPPLHSQLVGKAQNRGLSLNRLCVQLIQLGLAGSSENRTQDLGAHYAEAVTLLRRRFGDDLVGVALFGSQVTGESHTGSDHDLLVVLRPAAELSRSLYQWWDDAIQPLRGEIWNPHFVRLPAAPEEVGGLWLEVASSHQIIWEVRTELTHFFSLIHSMIAKQGLRRYWSNGHSYWVKTDAEQNAGG